MLDSEVHNTARYQLVYIDLVMDCALTLRSYLYLILSISDIIDALYLELNDMLYY